MSNILNGTIPETGEIKGTISTKGTMSGGIATAFGKDGKSAYEVAVKNGFEGSEAEWLESLVGESGADGNDGADGTNGTDGKDGKSAYEIAVDNGFEGTEEEWLESLKGEKGDTGNSGVYLGSGEMPEDCNVQIDPSGNVYTYEDLKGDKGDPFTYEDFTPEQLESLKGEKGDSFTYEDFTPEQLESLKGDKGEALTFDDLTEEQKMELVEPFSDIPNSLKQNIGFTTYKEGVYINYAGVEKSQATMTSLKSVPITSGVYELKGWVAPSQSNFKNNTICFYDDTDTVISFSSWRSTLVGISDEEKTYRVTAPENVSYAIFNVLTAEVNSAFIKKVLNEENKTDIKWLEVAEVADARQGYDGTVYDSLGEAIRGQAKASHDEISDFGGFTEQFKLPKIQTELYGNGYINYSGVFKEHNLHKCYKTTGEITSGVYEFRGRYGINDTPSNGYTNFNLCLYDSNDNVVILDRTTVTSVDEANKIFTVNVPEGVSYILINTLTTEENLLYIRKILNENSKSDIKWLEVDRKQITFDYVDFLDSIEKPFDFNGKSIVSFGDSITAGVTSNNLAVTQNSYIKLFANHVGATLTNKAVSGTCITDSADVTNSIYKRVTTHTYSGDFIIVAGGINDFATGKPLGSYDSTDVTTFYGALRGICEHLKTNKPEAKVIFITPVNLTRTTAAAIHDLSEYRKAIFEIATLYKFSVVSGTTLGLPSNMGNWGNEMMGDSDGVHPSELGHYQYYKGLCTKLL